MQMIYRAKFITDKFRLYDKVESTEKRFWLDKNNRFIEEDCIDEDKNNIAGSVLSNSTSS